MDTDMQENKREFNEKPHVADKPAHKLTPQKTGAYAFGTNKFLSAVAVVQVVILLIIAVQLGGLDLLSESTGSVTGGVVAVADNGGAAAAPAAAPTLDLEALQDDDPFLGPADAEIVVVEFSDFECPYCGAAMGTHEGLVSQFKSRDPSWEAAVPELKKLAEAGKIKLVFRDFPLSFHQNAQKAAEAGECANDQGKFWELHDKMFEQQTNLGVTQLKAWASELGLDTAKFNKCLDSGEKASEVANDLAAGSAAGVQGTPAFFVNGQLLSGAQPWAAFEQVLGLN